MISIYSLFEIKKTHFPNTVKKPKVLIRNAPPSPKKPTFNSQSVTPARLKLITPATKELRDYIDANIKGSTDLLAFMKDVKYGWVKDGKPTTDINEEEMDKHYRLLQPEEVFKYKVGVCNDQALFEYYVLTYLGYQCMLYGIHQYYRAGHVFLIFKTKNGLYHFENSFHKIRGIHGPYKNPMDVIKSVAKAMNDYKPSKEGYGYKKIDVNKILFKYNIDMTTFLTFSGFDFSKQ